MTEDHIRNSSPGGGGEDKGGRFSQDMLRIPKISCFIMVISKLLREKKVAN